MFVPPTPGSTRSCSTQQSTTTPPLSEHEQQQQQQQPDTDTSVRGTAEEEAMPPPTAMRMVDTRRPTAAGGITEEAAESAGGDEGLACLAETEGKPSDAGESLRRVPAAMTANEESLLSLGEAAQVLCGEDWRHKASVLRQIREQLAAEGRVRGDEEMHELAIFMDSLAMVCGALRDALTEVPGSVRLTQLICGVISDLAKAAGPRFCEHAASIIPELLPFLSTPKEAVQQAVTCSVEVMVAECPSSAVLRAATVPLVGSKKACSSSLRRKGSCFLRVAIEHWPQVTLRASMPPIMRQMRHALFDTDATVRREGRHTFGVFIRLWPAEGGGMYHALDRANQRAVLQEQPHVSNFIGTTTAAGAGAGAATTAASTAAIANAATRVAMGGVLAGEGGGGGQRAAGVTRAHHLSLRQLKIEKAKRRLSQQRKQQREERREQRLSPASTTGGQQEEEEEEMGASFSSETCSIPADLPAANASSPRALFVGRSPAAGAIPADIAAVNASSPRAALGGRLPAASPSSTAATAAAAAAAAAAATAASPMGSPRFRPQPVFFSSPRGGGGPGSASRALGPSLTSPFGSPRARPSGFFSSPRGCASPRSASRAVAPASSSSNGLRRAANMALSKNDLMSPTLKRLLQEPSKLQTLAATAATTSTTSGDVGRKENTGGDRERREITGGDSGKEEGVAISVLEGGGSGKVLPAPRLGEVEVEVSSPPVGSPGSDESGLREERGGSGDSSSGGDGGGGRVTPADLRRSMGDYGEDFESSPFSAKFSGGGASRENLDGSFVSSCSESDSSSSSEDEEQEETEGEKEGEKGVDGEKDCSLPTRVLFAHDQSPPQQQGKAPSSGTFPPRATIAAAAATGSATARKGTGFPALEMKCPPPREPTKHASGPMATPVGGGAQSSSTSYREQEAGKHGGRRVLSSQNSATNLTSPRALPYHVTPKRMGILAGGKGGVSVGASSTVKRRVRFVMEERGGALSSASLNSPCRANENGLLPSVGGWWGRTGDGAAGGVVGRGDESSRPRGWRRLLSLFVSALAAIAIGVVVTAAFHDEQGNSGSFEARRTTPVYSPVLPSLEPASAGYELPVTPSVAEGGGEEEEEEEVVGVVSGESDDGVDFSSTLSALPSPLKLAPSEDVVDAVGGSWGQREVVEGAKAEEEEKAQREEKEDDEEGVCDLELAATGSLDDVDVASNPGTDKADLPASTDNSDAYAASPPVSSGNTDDAPPAPEGNVGQDQAMLEVDEVILGEGEDGTAATAGNQELGGKVEEEADAFSAELLEEKEALRDAGGKGIGEGRNTEAGSHAVPAAKSPKTTDPVAAGGVGAGKDDIRGEKESVQPAGEGVQRMEGIQRAEEGVLLQRMESVQRGEDIQGESRIHPTEISPTTASTTATATATATAAYTADGTREKSTRRSSTSPSSWSRFASGRWDSVATFFSKLRWSEEAGSTASHSEWGLLEAGVAVFGALALWATVIFKSRPLDGDDSDSMAGSWDGGDGGGSMMGSWEGGDGGGAMSTPTGKGAGGGAGEGDGEFGSYSTVEMVKRGGTPATLRSVKRSRRISSSHKKPKSSMVVVDLGTTAFDISNA